MRRLRVGVLGLLLVAAACTPPGGGAAGQPPAPTGLTAGPGGGSGEVVVTWTPAPAMAEVAFYRVYQRKVTPGLYWPLAVVTDAYLGALEPGRIGIVDAPDYWPWPSTYASGVGTSARCYVVTAVSRGGLESQMSAEVCGAPPGGP